MASPAVQKALGSDIRLLGDLLGRTIRRLAGETAFQLEEEVRAAAKELRANPSPEAARTLRDRLGQLDLPALRTLTRAFSVYFDLINLAEQQARVRALRHRAGERADRHRGRDGRGRPAADPGPRGRRRRPGRPPGPGAGRARCSPPTRARPGGGPSSKSSPPSPSSSTGWSTAS